jgi:BioD-like phosphotransacetylase family protein
MKNIIIGSVDENAGKTSLIVGMAKLLAEKFGYLKPFGDRLIYRKKRLWDYDSALLANIFGLEQGSENMTIGFEHSKLRYMYDETTTRTKLMEMMHNLEANNTVVFIEGSKNLTYGSSIHLDTLSLAKYTGGKLIMVIAGDDSTIIDDITFVKKYVNMTGIDFSVVINKVQNIEDYKETHLQDIKDMGVEVLGVIPYEQDLTYVPVSYVADKLQARVIAGEGGLERRVKNVFVGAMSVDTATRLPLFRLENKLAITGGDRSDMIVAALESSTSGIILTANIIPPQNIIAKAADKNIPLLLVPFDTFRAAKQVDDMIPLLTREDSVRTNLLQKLISQHVDTKHII